MRSADLEQFYSDEKVLRTMIQTLKEKIPECNIYVDPSAGDGALLRFGAPQRAKKLSYDIQPRKGSRVQKHAFESPFAQNAIARAIGQFDLMHSRRPLVCVASNPPFKQIKKWLLLVEPWADWVMFLAPLQYFRFAYQTDVPAGYQLHYQRLLEDSVFLEGKTEKPLRTTLQVWRKVQQFPLLSQPLFPLQKKHNEVFDVEFLGITEWQFAPWSEFHERSDQQRICISRKTGKTWLATSYRNKQCTVREKIPGTRNFCSSHQPTSTSYLIVCRTERVRRQLLKVGRLVQAYRPPMGCTRDSFHKLEFCWFWLKYNYPERWKEMSENAPMKAVAKDDNLVISPLDEFLFKWN